MFSEEGDVVAVGRGLGREKGESRDDDGGGCRADWLVGDSGFGFHRLSLYGGAIGVSLNAIFNP